MKVIRSAAVVLSALALSACAPSAPADVPAPSPQTTVVAQVTPTPAPEATDATGPQATPGGEGYSVSELDGVAGLYDPVPMHETYEEAKAENDEVIGWITLDGTVIDYPVLRTGDNDFYLTHDASGNDSKYGAIYMDFRNAESHMQKHIIIYGHNMKNGTMFHDLSNYKQKDFFNENRRIYLLWDGADTEWEIFCAFIVEPDTIYPIHTLFGSDENFADVMNDTIKYANTVKPSNVDDTVTIQPSDQVLSLLTCTYEYDDSRFVVMGRRVK